MAKKELEEIAELAATKAVAKAEKRFERYVGVIKEDVDHKLDAVLEYVEEIPGMKQKLDLTFDQVGELKVDMEVVKNALKDHEHRIQKLEVR